MINTNILHRTFQLKYEDRIGTCFSIDHSGRQYLITARHVIEGISNSDTIHIYYKGDWNWINVELVGLGSDNIDVGVLAPPIQLSPTLELEPTTKGIYLGQEVYFLGFPYGLRGEISELNRQFPLPLVKKGTLSASYFGPDKNLLVDGHNNPGFSGGPVIFSHPNAIPPVYKVAGVISGFQYQWESIFLENEETSLRFKYNTGIVVAHNIQHVIHIIESNPIGFLLSSNATINQES